MEPLKDAAQNNSIMMKTNRIACSAYLADLNALHSKLKLERAQWSHMIIVPCMPSRMSTSMGPIWAFIAPLAQIICSTSVSSWCTCAYLVWQFLQQRQREHPDCPVRSDIGMTWYELAVGYNILSILMQDRHFQYGSTTKKIHSQSHTPLMLT